MEHKLAAKHLVVATRLGDKAALERLCTQDPLCTTLATEDGLTALQVACSLGNMEIVKVLLDNGALAVLNTPSRGTGMTPLMLAACGGYNLILTMLTAHGADTSSADKNGWTALHHAAFKGKTVALQALLAADAAVDAQTIKGETPLALAAVMEQDEVCRTLVEYNASVDLLASESDKAFVAAATAEDADATGARARSRAASVKMTKSEVGTEYSFDSVSEGGSPAQRSESIKRPPRIEGATQPPADLMSNRKSSRSGSANATGNGQQLLSMAEMRLAPYAITLPSGPRKVSPMYVPPNGTTSITTTAQVLQALELRNRKDSEWVLQAFSYRGVPDGFLLDKDTSLVYWVEGPATSNPGAAGATSTAAAGSPARALRPQLPQLVGKLQPGLGGLSNPSLGTIVPLTAGDAVTLELSAPGMRCLRRQSPAAALLVNAAKRGEEVLADLVPELGGAAYCRGVSLAAPLCAVLGVHETSDLSLLTAKDLLNADVDPYYLPALLDLGDTAPPRPETASPRAVDSPRSSTSMSTSLPVLPTLSQLLIKHGLAKLLPIAADRKLLSTAEIHHWGDLSSGAAGMTLSAPELVRLKAFVKSIKAAQEQALALQASRLELLSRLTVGSLVVYEADPLRAWSRGERLAGIILEDLGVEAVGSVTGSQFKVRDLLDDTLAWQYSGQVRRLTPVEANNLLRADLLPPTSPGAPVTPLSAAAGLRVHLAPWSRSTAMLDEYLASGIVAEPTLESSGGGAAGSKSNGGADDEPTKAMLQVIGVLQEPVSEDRQIWSVVWPDGIVRTHMVGANNKFELVHIHLHKAAGAPLTRSHFKLLLGSKDMMAVPIVRSPLWPRASTDDSVPGSPGLGFLDAAQAAVTVIWSRNREQGASLYCPDAQGVYPLCHGLLGSSGLSCLAAKSGVLVEAAPGASPAVVASAAQGPGTLLSPVAFNSVSGKVTWRVKWQSGSVTLHDLGANISDAELLVSETYTGAGTDRVVLLNEVSKRAAKAVPAFAAVAKAMGVSSCGCGCGGSGGCRRVAGLGRPLFCTSKDAAKAHTWGMLGNLVKLNLVAISLQPGCDQGPLCSYEPRLLSESLQAKKDEIDLGPIPRDDVGIVVKDAGPGAWRSLLVRKLGSTQSFWYDESVLLPATPDDVKKQVVRNGPQYVPPRNQQGVPVTDANAAPGMLVQRMYAPGAAQEGSDKALTVGELVKPAGAHAWQVAWPDGSVGTYKTGATNRFQLCFVNLHELAGSPLLATTVQALAAASSAPIPVIDGPHIASGGMKPGSVRYVNDPLTQQGLQLQEVAQLQATGMVATSAGERCMAGGPLRLYELCHGIVSGDAVTVFTAKRGLRVMLASPEDENSKDDRAAVAPVRIGTLRSPTRLAVRAVLDAGSGAGSGMPGGPTASREPVLLQDPAVVYWEVEWSNGRIEEVLVGTTPGQTPLRIAGSPSRPESQEREESEEQQQGYSYEKVVKQQHFVRMLEPVMLLPCVDSDMTWALERVAQPLQRAVGWSNQMLRELCGVWWASARLAAAAAEAAERASGYEEESRKQLWRPHLTRVPVQPDLLTFMIKKRAGGALRWETLLTDHQHEVSNRVPRQLDERLAVSVDLINTNLLGAGADNGTDSSSGDEGLNTTMGGHTKPSTARHLVLEANNKYIETSIVLNELGRPDRTSEAVEDVLSVANGAITEFRKALIGEIDPERDPDPDADQYDLMLALEPSMSADRAPAGGCVVLHVAKEVPPPLEITADQDTGAEAPNADGPWAVGPLAILATGCQPVLQSAVLQAHRALGALSAGPCSSLMPGFNAGRTGRQTQGGKEGEALVLVGRTQDSMWLDVPDRAFPQDVGQARCLASVNAQLFTLRRVCAFLNGCPGGGTANVSEMLLGVLHVVREKAAAALALEAGKNLVDKAAEAVQKADDQVKEQQNGASDIQPFHHQKQDALLKVTAEAMQRLTLAEAFSHKACAYAEAAQPPLTMPAIDPSERQDAQLVQKKAKEQLIQTIEQYNYIYPVVIEAMKIGLLSLTKVMREKQLDANELHVASRQAQLDLAESKKQWDAAERNARSAEDDVAAAKQKLEQKHEAHDRLMRGKEEAEKSLREAEAELQAAQASVPLPSGDAEGGAAAAAANARVSSAEAAVTERRDYLNRALQNMEVSKNDLATLNQGVIDAQALFDQKRDGAKDHKNNMTKLQAKLNGQLKTLRTLDPGSLSHTLTPEKILKMLPAEKMARQVEIARKTSSTSVASLNALQGMLSNIPSCMFAPEAVARLLGRTVSAATLLAAAAWAECARTSTLPLEAFLLELEDKEAAAQTVAAFSGGLPSASITTKASMTAGSTMAAGAGGISVPPVELPAIDEVYRLMTVIRNDVLVSVRQFAELIPHVPDETTISEGEGNSARTLSRSVLSAVVDRAMLTAATTLDRLGQCAAANVTNAITQAALAAEAAKQASGVQGANAGITPSTTDALPVALNAARVATLVAETARIFPTTSADMPVSDQKLATQLVSLLKSAQNANNVASKESTKLSNEQVVKLNKSGLGTAATPEGVRCSVYSELAIKATSIIESQYWCNEAAGLFPKARAAADNAIAALAPAPPALLEEEAEEGEGEDGPPEKKKEDPAELAAKAAAAAEAERVINRYVSHVALTLAKAAGAWAHKLMDPLANSSSFEEITEEQGVAIVAHTDEQAQLMTASSNSSWKEPSLSGAPMDMSYASQSGAAPSQPPSVPAERLRYPDDVVSVMRDMAEPLRIADMAFRQAGNHTGLDEIDDDLKDVLQVVSEAAYKRTDLNMDTLRDLQDKILNPDVSGSLNSVQLRGMRLRAMGLVRCANDAVEATRMLVTLVPLVLPTEDVSRKTRDAALRVDELIEQASSFYAEVDVLLDGLTGDVTTALTSNEAMMESLEPSFAQLEVRLDAQASSTVPTRPMSPSRLRGTRRGFPSPPTFGLKLSVPAPGNSDRYKDICKKVTDRVFGQPTVQALLAPYQALLQALNEAACSIHAAAAAEPSDAEIESLLNPGSLAAAKTLSHTSGDHFITSTNMLQLKRWSAAVANMSASTSLVLRGFIEATERSSTELAPLEMLWIS